MTAPLTPEQFHEAVGFDDWRVLLFFNGACTYYRTGSFAKGLALVNAIGEVAEAADHHPDVDLRIEGVTVRLKSFDVGWLTERDVRMATKISALAREQGLKADPAAVQEVNLTIDALSRPEIMPFWRAVLGYEQVGGEDLVDRHRHGPTIWYQDMDEARPQRNRIHVDVAVPHDQAEARIAAALAAGGRLVSDVHAPMWWTLADPEGNEVDVCTWMGRFSS
jgi:4a-hydroxytetrahydrobiopterin dehydratase